MAESPPDTRTILLPHKPTAPLSYTLSPGSGSLSHTHLVVFLNGLIVPQTGWFPALSAIPSHRPGGPFPSLLTYDRYGQGSSARDPSDAQARDGVHDMVEVARDLNVLIREIWNTTTPTPTTPTPHLVLVASSVGCVLARLYAQMFPRTVLALLLLDSNIANTDFVSLFPDPDAPAFDPAELPGGVGVEVLRRVRNEYARLFHPSVPNPEHLDRRNVAALLPYADKPMLEAPPLFHEEHENSTETSNGPQGPWLAVVGHDPERFAEDSETGTLQCPRSLTYRYVQTAWARYNEGMLRITQRERRLAADGTTGERDGEVVIATGCGHFVMRDDPDFVARWVARILQKISGEE